MKLSILALLGIIPSLSGQAMAGNYEFTGSFDNRWANAGNWSPNGIPTIGDHVLIPTGKLCIVSEVDGGESADTIEVESGAELRLNHYLVLYGDFYHATGGTSVINGLVTINEEQANNVFGQFTFSNYDHVVQGSGAIEGHGGRLRIIGNRLQNELATSGKGIRGKLRIEGQPVNNAGGILRNLGLVDAEGENNVLVLEYATTLEDSEAAVWRTATCGTLVFKKQALNLVGDFICGGTHAAYFEFQATIRTCGTYTRNGGGLTIASGKTFDYAHFATSGCGSNPGTMPCESEDCACKYVVWSSVSACGALCGEG